MDFFMKSTTSTFPTTDLDHVTALRTLFHIYELTLRSIFDDVEEASLLHLNMRDDNAIDSPSRAILTSMNELTRATKQHGANLVGNLPKYFTQELSVRASPV